MREGGGSEGMGREEGSGREVWRGREGGQGGVRARERREGCRSERRGREGEEQGFHKVMRSLIYG